MEKSGNHWWMCRLIEVDVVKRHKPPLTNQPSLVVTQTTSCCFPTGQPEMNDDTDLCTLSRSHGSAVNITTAISGSSESLWWVQPQDFDVLQVDGRSEVSFGSFLCRRPRRSTVSTWPSLKWHTNILPVLLLLLQIYICVCVCVCVCK